jgi:Acyl-CoA synthetases (AMP-forming)/AMP-acid ligases II
MPIATIEKLAAKIPGLRLINAYGSTETTSPSTIMPPELTAAHLDSVGLPCPGAHIIVMDADGRELPRGEIGEIWIHSGSVIRGYWNNPRRRRRVSPAASGTPAISVRSTRRIWCGYSIARKT